MQRLWRTLEMAAWAAFFALAAAVLVLRYVVLPHIERLRPEIVERVSAIVGQPVKIGGIEAQWLGLRPQVNLTDVRIYDAEGREALVLPSVENILSWRSLMRGTLNLYALHIDGPRLVVRRDATGTLYVAGMKLVATPGEPGFSDWLFAQHDIEVRNAEIEWRDEQRAAPPLVLSSLNLRLNNDGERHSLGFAAGLPENLGTSVELRAEVAAQDIDELRAWNGRVYAQVGYTDVAAWRPWLDYPLEFERGQAALRLWLTVAAGMPSEATADIALADVQTRLGAELPPLELASALGRISARRAGDGYELGTTKLTLAPRDGAPLPPLDFDVLAGELAWRRDGTSLSVDVPSLTFTNADLSGNAFGSYVYDDDGPGKIDVSAVLSRADARSLPHYLPLGVLMGEKPREWLVKGILAGEATKVELRLKGDLRAFPFVDPAQGEFSATARVRKGVLEYAPGWPRIDDIA